jgi:predicted nucleic acid-binding protein
MPMTVVSVPAPGPVLGPGDRVFLDANVSVFLTVMAAPFHAAAVAAVNRLRTIGCDLWISRQVLREYLAAVTRPQPYAPPTPTAVATANVRRLAAALPIAEDGPAVTVELLNLLGRVPCHGKQVHDANTAATMIARGVPNLLTHNVADFTRFAPAITVIPL